MWFGIVFIVSLHVVGFWGLWGAWHTAHDPDSERRRLGYIGTNAIVWWVSGFLTAVMCLKFNVGM